MLLIGPNYCIFFKLSVLHLGNYADQMWHLSITVHDNYWGRSKLHSRPNQKLPIEAISMIDFTEAVPMYAKCYIFILIGRHGSAILSSLEIYGSQVYAAGLVYWRTDQFSRRILRPDAA